MEIEFKQAWRWYKRGQRVNVPAPIGKLWVLMGRATEVKSQDTDVSVAESAAVETATLPGYAEAAVAPPGIERRRGRRRRDENAAPQSYAAGDH